MKTRILMLLPVLASLAACSISGYGGTSKFRCAPGQQNNGDPLCASISGNYQASVSGTLGTDVRHSTQPYSQAAVHTLMRTPALHSGTPIRSQSEIARIWIAPYLDTDGDLVDQSFTYVVLNEGRWLIEHNRQNIVDEYRPIRLLGGQSTEQGAQNASAGKEQDRVPDVGMQMNLQQIANPARSSQ